MFESLGLENWTPLGASLVAGAIIGLLFGVLAQRSRFCLRRGLVGDQSERSSALGLWLTALLVAIAGTQVLVATELADFSTHRFLSSNIAVPAIILGGLLFGAGMVLARGCASRLTVLTGTGNLRALVAIITFSIVAHATLKGILAPARVWLSSFTFDLGNTAGLTDLPGSPFIWIAITVAVLIVAITRLGVGGKDLAYGAAIGALVPLGWFVTGTFLFDEFDPIVFESLAFTSASSEALFWTVAGTAIAPGFGVGFFGGVLSGSALAALTTREFEWSGFNQDVPTQRYLIGGSLMGVGGVLAGGCTVGAGLSGVSTLSFSAILALSAIIAGALTTKALMSNTTANAQAIPAE